MKKKTYRVCGPNEIQIDLDARTRAEGDRRARKCRTALNILERETKLRIVSYEEHRSKGGTGMHVTIRLRRNAPILWRVFIALLLGSDHWRELLNYCRIVKGSPDPIIFWEKNS